MIWDIGFKTDEDRQKFEKEHKDMIKHTLVHEEADSSGFMAWTMTRCPKLDIVYYVGFMGYEDPNETLKECDKKNININYFASLPVNDRGSQWQVLRDPDGDAEEDEEDIC